MRGGLERWKRGEESRGVRQAVAYALDVVCDAAPLGAGVESAARYGETAGGVTRFSVTSSGIDTDRLDGIGLVRWIDGCDPITGASRGRSLTRPDADLLLDATVNMPKSVSLAVLLTPALRQDLEALQDRLRDRTLRLWQRELNARRGAGGLIREGIARLEVVELRHERSRALDPHVHRHLWLNVKVRGEDGLWSNVDSRVAMRLHTLVNAEGDLAARADPEWVAALARHGYTIDVDGEVAQLAHLVRPLSRRSNQIEANRSFGLAEWRRTNPGRRPDHAVIQAIDRLAWARSRPGKPEVIDELGWAELIRSEIRDLDPSVLAERRAVQALGVDIGRLDRDFLAELAIADADGRSVSTGGRFSVFDVTAGAVRAIASSGVVADRKVLDEVIEDVVARAVAAHTVDFLPADEPAPKHVKRLIATTTATAKVDLAARFDGLASIGEDVPVRVVERAAASVLGSPGVLDSGQVAAVAAVAGSSGLVTVTGPAGAGKTTLLLVARTLLASRGRRMMVVAPTKKAASVAGREIGTAASSLHALLFDHGYRFAHDRAGGSTWTKVMPGTLDPTTGRVYEGPLRYPIRVGDRIVVDEAGMVDLHLAAALADLAAETGAGIAMIGDPLQARPVGHSGAMAIMSRRSRAIELTEVHRFRDPDYAALTVRLRDPADLAEATAAARGLADRGLVQIVSGVEAARESMVRAWLAHADKKQRVALVTSTNAEAQVVNDRIQQERLDRGNLDPTQWASGRDGQFLLVGDIVQTRRNDSAAGVENRATWTVARIDDHQVVLTAIDEPSDVRAVGRGYAAEHMHLAYASTVHGIQGDTVHTSYVGPDVDAAGLYVGMTRGRHRNVVLVRATTEAEAIDAIAEIALRGRPEVTLEDSRRAARRELDRSARARSNRAESSVAGYLVELRNEGRELDVALATEDALAHGRREAPDVEALRVRRDAIADAVGQLDRSMRASRVSREIGGLDPGGAELPPSAGRGVSI